MRLFSTIFSTRSLALTQRRSHTPVLLMRFLLVTFLLDGSCLRADDGRIELGPDGGKIQTILVMTPYVDNVVCGSGDGRIFHSSDRGETWTASSVPADRAGYSVETIIAGQCHEILWAGIRHEDGTGRVWRSLDAGKKWSLVAGSETLMAVRSLLLRHDDNPVLFAGTTEGLFRSNDEGSTWSRVFLPAPSASVASLEQSADGMMILLGTWRRGFRSTDGGVTFQPIWNGMTEDSHIFTFVRHPLAQGIVYAATCGWVYRSQHNGDTWLIKKNGLDDRRIYSLALVPTGSELLIAGTADGIFTSADQAATWQYVGLKDHTILSLAIDPINDIVYAGLDGAGVYTSRDRGKSFVPASNGIHAAQVSTISAKGPRLAGIVNLAASRYGLLYLEDISATEKAKMVPLPDDIGDPMTSLLDENDDNGHLVLFVGTFKGLFCIQVDQGPSLNKTIVPGPVTSLVRHPLQANTLFATGFDGLYRSMDNGTTWQKTSPSDFNGQTFSLAIDNGPPNHLYLGTQVGIFRSDDLGENWQLFSHNLPKRKTTIILSNPTRPDHMIALSAFGLYASLNAAQTWAAMPVYDFPRHTSLIFFDPRFSSVLFANDLANGGLHISRNGGTSWKALPELIDLRINTCIMTGPVTESEPLVLLCATSGHGLVRLVIDTTH